MEIGSMESKKGPKLAYDLEFRKMLRESPGLIKTAIELCDKAIAEYNPNNFRIAGDGMEVRYDKDNNKWLEAESGQVYRYNRGTLLVPGEKLTDPKTGLEIQVLGRSNRENMGHLKRRDLADYFKATIQGKSYFVKRSFITVNPGFQEFHNTRWAEWLINNKDLIQVVQPKLGYQDTKESWYISEWKEIENAGYRPVNYAFVADDYGNRLGLEPGSSDDEVTAHEKEQRFVEKLEAELREVLTEDRLQNDISANLFYNPKTGKFIKPSLSTR